MSTDESYDTLEDTDYEPRLDSDLYDPAKTTDAEFLAAMQKMYHSEEPAPAPQPAPESTLVGGLLKTSQPTPTSTKRALADLQTQIENIDKQIQGPDVELRAQRLALQEQADRLSDAVTYEFDGKPDADLQTMAEDAVLQLDELGKAIRAMPAESMRSEADKVRLARAERERRDLLAKQAALHKETVLRRELEGYNLKRLETIDAKTMQAIQAERAQALNARLKQVRSEPDYEPWLDQAVTREMNAVPITAEDIERKRKEIETQFDRQIAEGVRKENIRAVGGNPDPHWTGFGVSR